MADLNDRIYNSGCSCHIDPPCSYCMSLTEEEFAEDRKRRFYSPDELAKLLKGAGFKEIKMREKIK